MWRNLEMAVRHLNNQDHIFETYVLTAPVLYFDRRVEAIGDITDEYGIDVPIPPSPFPFNSPDLI